MRDVSVSPSRWSHLVDEGLSFLASLAAERSSCDFATFDERACGGAFDLRDPLQRDQLDELLADISRRSIATHDVMISCLVHGPSGRQHVGRAFFELAARSGYLPRASSAPQRALFLAQHVADTYQAYGRRPI